MNWCPYCNRVIGDNSHRCRSCQYMERTQVNDNDPTPDEIRERCEEIQAGWDEAERARRAGSMQEVST